MRVCDLPGLQSWLYKSAVGRDLFWNQELSAISERQIQLFYARSALLNLREAAHEAIERAQTVAIREALNKRESSHALVLHTPPVERFMVDEFIDAMARLRVPRRDACIFALETNTLPSAVVKLTWSEVGSIQGRSSLAGEILEHVRKTRHIRLPYVFWEWASDQIATPLLGFQQSVEDVFDLTWPALAIRYREMILVDRRADSAGFMSLLRDLHPT